MKEANFANYIYSKLVIKFNNELLANVKGGVQYAMHDIVTLFRFFTLEVT